MKKIIMILLCAFISLESSAQKNKIVGSWMKKSEDASASHVVMTFNANGTYRMDNFEQTEEEEIILQKGVVNSGKWEIDEDGVLCVYQNANAETAFAKCHIRENSSLPPAKRKLLLEQYSAQERDINRIVKNYIKNNGSKENIFYDIRFNEDGELEMLSIRTSIWETYVKVNRPWTPAANSRTPNTARKPAVRRR